MNLNFLCCIGAEQKHDQSGMLKMNQVYFYRAYADETMSEILKDNFFNHSESHLKENDIILAYSPNEKDLPKVRWLRIVIPHAGLVKTEKVDNSYLLEVLRQDLADLGDQVAEIEAKIPGSASVINQLATQNDITNKITNCITEIPQDIKLELMGGTLTLKAGSKVYVPNGSGVFDVVTINSDISGTRSSPQTCMVFILNNSFVFMPVNLCYSGTTAPTSSQYMVWYDTTNNKIKYTSDSGSTWQDGFSLPFCIATSANNAIASIDQVFNGFGYMGSTVFVLPGVKGLIPNGKNEDGTLKNISVTTQTVLTATRNSNLSNGEAAFSSSSIAVYLREYVVDELPTTSTNGQLVYLRPENKLYTYSNGWVETTICTGMFFDKTNNGIENFSTKSAFRAVDYNDTDFIAHQAMPSDKYIDLSSTTITDGMSLTAPADGYYSLCKVSSAAGQMIGLLNAVSGLAVRSYASNTGETLGVIIPVSKGQTITVRNNAGGNTTYFRFIYANGSK